MWCSLCLSLINWGSSTIFIPSWLKSNSSASGSVLYESRRDYCFYIFFNFWHILAVPALYLDATMSKLSTTVGGFAFWVSFSHPFGARTRDAYASICHVKPRLTENLSITHRSTCLCVWLTPLVSAFALKTVIPINMKFGNWNYELTKMLFTIFPHICQRVA